METDDKWLMTAEVALLLRQPTSTLRYWRYRGTGPRGTKFGKRVLYRESDVHAWMRAQEAAQHTETRPAPRPNPQPRPRPQGSPRRGAA